MIPHSLGEALVRHYTWTSRYILLVSLAVAGRAIDQKSGKRPADCIAHLHTGYNPPKYYIEAWVVEHQGVWDMRAVGGGKIAEGVDSVVGRKVALMAQRLADWGVRCTGC